MALQHARDVHTRRNEGSCIWVVKTKDIFSSMPEDESSFFDKSINEKKFSLFCKYIWVVEGLTNFVETFDLSF